LVIAVKHQTHPQHLILLQLVHSAKKELANIEMVFTSTMACISDVLPDPLSPITAMLYLNLPYDVVKLRADVGVLTPAALIKKLS